MKRIILIIALLASCALANAQIEPSASEDIRNGMSYKEIKDLYNYRDYIKEIGDPYSPGISGACSFFVPGLGQILNEEVGRGFLIMGGGVILSCLATIGAYNETDAGALLVLASMTGVVVLDVWSVFDAVKIARVKNMYHQDLRRAFSDRVDLKLSPSLAYIPSGNGVTPTAGVSLKLVF